MAKGKKGVLAMYYAQVNDITPAEANLPVHAKRMMNALQEVCGYEGYYDGESGTGREVRQEMMSKAVSGEHAAIAQYFKNLYPELYKGKQDWDVIFCMQNMCDAHKKKASVKNSTTSATNTSESKAVVSAAEKAEEKQERMKEVLTSSDKNISYKEDTKMSNFDANKAIEEGAADVEAMLSGTMGSPVAEGTDAATQKAVDASVSDDMDTRIANAKNWNVTNLIYLKEGPAKVYKQEADGKVYGKVKDPEAQLKKFKEATGYVVDETGKVQFKALMVGDGAAYNAAMDIIAQLEEAVKNPDKLFEAYVSKSKPALKGVKLKKGATQEPVVLNKEECITEVLDHSVGKVFLVGNAAQLEVKATSSRNKSKGGVATTTATKKGALQLRLNASDASATAGMAMYIRTVDDSKFEYKKGGRSALCVKYNKGTFGQDGQWIAEKKKDDASKLKVMTYRIPLEVPQYELVDDTELIVKFPIRTSGEMMNLTTKEGQEKLAQEFKTLLGEALNTDILKKTDIGKKISMAKGAVQAQAAEAAGAAIDDLE